MMEKGDIRISYFIGGVIAVIVLVIVGFGIYSLITGEFPFFQWLGFNRTVSVVVNTEILRYDLAKQNVEYYDGTRWNGFQGDIDLGKKKINYDNIRGDFWNYLGLFESDNFQTKNFFYDIIHVDLNEIRVQRRTDNISSIIIFKYNGEAGYLEESKVKEKIVGVFSKPDDSDGDGNFEYTIDIDDEVLNNDKYQAAEFFVHLREIDEGYFENYLVPETEGSRAYYKLEACVKGLAGDIGRVGCRYKLVDGRLLYEGTSTGIFIYVKKESAGEEPASISVNVKDYIYNKLDSLASELLEAKRLSYQNVFGRAIKIKDEFYCPELKDSRYLTVFLDRPVENDKEECS